MMDSTFFIFDACFNHVRHSFRFQIITVGNRSESHIHASGISTANTNMVFLCFLGQKLADSLHSIIESTVSSCKGIVLKIAAAQNFDNQTALLFCHARIYFLNHSHSADTV